MWKEIKKVDKDDINVMLYHWEQVCDNEVTPFSTNFVYWNTYERDWAKSDKTLGDATKNGSTIHLSGKRKYTGDWFAFEPTDIKDNPIDLNYIYYNWAKWHDSDNSKVKIWRIQP